MKLPRTFQSPSGVVVYPKHQPAPGLRCTWEEKKIRSIQTSVTKTRIPKGTKTESALFTSDTIIRFIGVIAVYQILSRTSESMGNRQMCCGLTFEVKPPRSGVLRMCFKVPINLGSDYSTRKLSKMITND